MTLTVPIIRMIICADLFLGLDGSYQVPVLEGRGSFLERRVQGSTLI